MFYILAVGIQKNLPQLRKAMNQFKFQFSQAYDGYLLKDHTQLHYSRPSDHHKHYLLIVLLIDLQLAMLVPLLRQLLLDFNLDLLVGGIEDN